MLGWIDYQTPGIGTPKLQQERRCGGTFLVLDMGRGAQGVFASRRASSAAQKMRAQGVRRAIFPVDFPHTAVFLRHGIMPVDPMPLRRTLAALYVRRRLDSLALSATRAVVAVAGERITEEMAQTARELALAYRYVLLSAGSGSEEFARDMRRKYGVSLLLSPSTDQLERADALVLFTKRDDLHGNNPVVCALYPGDERRGLIPLEISEILSKGIAPNCPTDQLAAALYSAGILPAQQLLGKFDC